MIKNILLPEKIGNYYLFPKKVLSFDINPAQIQACLLAYRGSSVTLEKKITLAVSESSAQTVESGIKHIVASVGQYDAVVTSVPGSQVVFKELEMPFIGRDKIAMVVGFEVEPFLPFSYQDAWIDFIILEEDLQNAKSKILVAATRKDDVAHLVQQFQQAHIQVDQVTVDLFSFYTLYQAALYDANNKSSELFIVIDLDTTTAIYMNAGQFKGSRVIPMGLSSIVSKISKAIGIDPEEALQNLLNGRALEAYNDVIASEIKSLAAQIRMSLKFFEKSNDLYQQPQQIYILGAGCCLPNLERMIQENLSMMVSRLNMAPVLEKLSVKAEAQMLVEHNGEMALVTALAAGQSNETNFLSHNQNDSRVRLVILQLMVLLGLTLGGFALIYWNVSSNISTLQSAYNRSRRELIDTVQSSMGITIKNSSPAQVVALAQETLKKESLVASSAQRVLDPVFLEYLQKLSIAMDRNALGLELTKVRLQYDSIVLNGSVNGFDELTDLQKKLALIKIFTIVEKPSTATNFTIKLQVNRQDEL